MTKAIVNVCEFEKRSLICQTKAILMVFNSLNDRKQNYLLLFS
jgi:hypothetical protein